MRGQKIRKMPLEKESEKFHGNMKKQTKFPISMCILFYVPLL